MDYLEIIEGITDEHIKKMLDKLDIPYVDKGEYILMPTVCHNASPDDASWKLYYYKNNKIFMCYTECSTMSIFKFLKHYYEARDISYDWYNDIYNFVLNCADYAPIEGLKKEAYHSLKETYGIESKFKELDEYSGTVMDCFIKYYPVEWLSDGITKEAMDKYNIRYSISQNKIIIPHYDINNRLVGIRGRALSEEDIECFGKYMPVQIEGKWYSHPLSMNLYGLNVNQDNIKKSGICYLFEGEKSVLLCENFRGPNSAVAVCGSNFNKYALNILLKNCSPREIVVCFDKEEKPKEIKYFYKLYDLCKKYSNYCTFSFVYDMKGLLDLKDSPVDKGEEVFNKLLEGRIKV